ncbi:glycosyltransferase [Candidatus Uhrbacteria bacterium]|nr:glycosyltransferase [Candidatus Uhrbacteria bacterium]
MKIGIDARMMGPKNSRGIGRYIEELIRAMIENHAENEYVLVARGLDHALKDHACVKTVVADIPWYSLNEQLQLPKVLNNLEVDLMHFPHWNVPITYSRPFVLTVHDLLLKHQKDSAKASTRSFAHRAVKRIGYKVVLDTAVRRAKRLCVPTQFVADDMALYYPAVKEKLVVTGEGISKMLDGSAEAPDYDYLLYVGSSYPHKRLDLLLEAWQKIAEMYPDLNLVIAGETDIFMQRMRDKVKAMNLNRVHFAGRVEDDVLKVLYKGARAFVFPSEFEGFGLPPLEALSVGTPVIASDSRPMPEVLGAKGVIYFKAGSRDGMIDSVRAVVDNLKSMRNQAEIGGRELLQKYTWKKAAALTIEAYNQAIKN